MNCTQSYLPITTGRIGLSQTTGGLEFYGHNFRGTGIGLFHGQSCWYPPCPPAWGFPSSCCSSCGCNPCSCGCFVSLLTNIGPWCRYWTDQQYAAWLTGQEPWPPSNTAALADLKATLPAACFPNPAAQAALASIGTQGTA